MKRLSNQVSLVQINTVELPLSNHLYLYNVKPFNGKLSALTIRPSQLPQMVSYKRFKAKENFKLTDLKVLS